MNSVVLTLPKPTLSELLKLVALPSGKESDHAEKLADRANEMVRMVGSVIDDFVSTAIEKRTAEDFKTARAGVFPQYFYAMRALGDLANIMLPRQTIERLGAEWFSEMEHDLRELGPAAFGSELTDRGIFTVWILRKIVDLAQEVAASPSLKGDETKDGELAMEFGAKALWTRFHVDCLTKSMRGKKPIYPDVVEPIRDGLRAAINTYACIRQWADIKAPRAEPELGEIAWTEEDELLLADSMRDLEREST